MAASTATVPHVLAPTGGEPVEGSAVTFTWEPVEGATRYRIQVSADEAFQSVTVDLPLPDTTSLTLYNLLPEDGATYYWRVQAGTDAAWWGWSPAETLTSVSDADAMAPAPRRTATVRPASRPGTPVAERPEEVAAPFQTGHTPPGLTLLFIVLFLFGMALIAYLISLGYDARVAASSAAVGALMPLWPVRIGSS
ncbi:MAG: fibronectin type III domain-containing protein [Bacteroidetes bacterium]|nr:MAG: fibronectin type III domain-containing protein [Bacteroidota bacterium]